jgi:hypothetical protein
MAEHSRAVWYDADGVCVLDSCVRSRGFRPIVSNLEFRRQSSACRAGTLLIDVICSLCVFCIRKRQRNLPAPPPRKVKKPALRRAEARERLKQFTHVADVTDVTDKHRIAPESQTNVPSTSEATSTPVAETASVSEREWYVKIPPPNHHLTTPS